MVVFSLSSISAVSLSKRMSFVRGAERDKPPHTLLCLIALLLRSLLLLCLIHRCSILLLLLGVSTLLSWYPHHLTLVNKISRLSWCVSNNMGRETICTCLLVDRVNCQIQSSMRPLSCGFCAACSSSSHPFNNNPQQTRTQKKSHKNNHHSSH